MVLLIRGGVCHDDDILGFQCMPIMAIASRNQEAQVAAKCRVTQDIADAYDASRFSRNREPIIYHYMGCSTFAN
ncbi:hypothetical protein SAMN02746095_00073 [Acidocella aminolytica 101 = DSM 11237]|nr:hypothetical protein SAMN02746095_00073 [Acidocella aminolytica 101 = DSM 11237]